MAPAPAETGGATGAGGATGTGGATGGHGRRDGGHRAARRARAARRVEAPASPAVTAAEGTSARTDGRAHTQRGARDAGGHRTCRSRRRRRREGRGRRAAGATPAGPPAAVPPRDREVVHARLRRCLPVDRPEPADQAPPGPGLERDDLKQAVVEPRHRGDVHAAAEGPSVADGDGVCVQRQFVAQALGVYEAAVELDPPAGHDGAQGRLRVGGAGRRGTRGRPRRVPVHEAAEARRERVDPVPLDGPTVEAGGTEPSPRPPCAPRPGQGGEVGVELVGDAGIGRSHRRCRCRRCRARGGTRPPAWGSRLPRRPPAARRADR